MAPPALPLLLLLLLLSHRYGHAAGAAAVSALDGFGRPVAWWVVLKLPMLAANGSLATCDCPPPDCSNVRADGDADQHGDANADQHERAAGLCYLYADARTPALRHFRDAGLDCLGQGGDDPLSHTLRQRHADDPDVYWALFNDQLDGIARPFEDQHGGPAPASPARTTCRGGDRFSAHAKGAAIFRVDHSDNQNDGQQQNDGRGQNAGRGGQNDGGGVFLQTSTPSFPDPSAVLNASAPFVRLGCQRDNNVLFAQHAAAISLGADAVDALADALRLARLCSANFYGGDLGRALASDNLRTAGAAGEPRVAAVYRALVDAAEPAAGGDADDAFVRRLRLPLRTPARSAAVFEPLVDQSPSLVDVNDQHGHQHGHQHEDQVEVEVLVKGPRAHAPPWALVAAALGADVSVASWWDEGFGIPSVCAGDAFAAAPHRFCLDDHHAGLHLLPPDARAPFNVENLIEATWTMRDGSGNLSWHLVGGRHARDGNHAKWGVTTPRPGAVNASAQVVTFGDLNMEGFPCSASCNGSQGGRGGAFWSLREPALHASLTQSLITKACRCSPPPVDGASADPDAATFETLRMCHFGCVKKIEEHWLAADLPVLGANASSFWPASSGP